MSDLICPACQRRNSQTAERCSQCGFLIHSKTPLGRSTLGIDTPPFSSEERAVGITTFLDELPRGAILFLVAEPQDQVIFENPKTIIIGRFAEEGDDAFFDVSKYGEMALGISRRHAQIILEDDQLAITDLGSTNGTWVNRQRLLAHEPFLLACEDVLHFGPILKVVICFHPLSEAAEGAEQGTQFVLQPTDKADPTIATSIQFLSSHVMTYLETIATIQGLLMTLQNRAAQPVSLVNFHLQDGQYVVTLSGAAEAVHLLQAGVNSWRKEPEHGLAAAKMPELRTALAPLAADLLNTVATAGDLNDKFPFIEKLAAMLAVAVSAPLQLHLKDK